MEFYDARFVLKLWTVPFKPNRYSLTKRWSLVKKRHYWFHIATLLQVFKVHLVPNKVNDLLGIDKVHVCIKFGENRLTFEYLRYCFVFISPTIALYSCLPKQAIDVSTKRLYVHTKGVLPCKVLNLLLQVWLVYRFLCAFISQLPLEQLPCKRTFPHKHLAIGCIYQRFIHVQSLKTLIHHLSSLQI